jgi:peptidylprolyl isomerase
VRRSVAAVLLPLLLVLTCCGGGSDDEGDSPSAKQASIDDISVSGAEGEKPEVDFKPPVTFEKTESEIVTKGPGKGDAITPESQVTVDYLGINASDGSEMGSTYGDGDQPQIFTVNQVVKAFSTGLEGAHAGDRVLIAAAPADAFGESGNPAVAVAKDTSIIFVVDVLDVATPLSEAKGKEVAAPADVPELQLDKDGHPTKFKATKTTPKTVDELGVYTVIEGTGPKVKSGQTITAHYVGQLYPDGAVFDSSWQRGQPAQFEIGTGGVIKGWDEGLVGQRVGSRVILVIPSALGYGKAGNPPSIPKNADLIFSIDILAAN